MIKGHFVKMALRLIVLLIAEMGPWHLHAQSPAFEWAKLMATGDHRCIDAVTDSGGNQAIAYAYNAGTIIQSYQSNIIASVVSLK